MLPLHHTPLRHRFAVAPAASNFVRVLAVLRWHYLVSVSPTQFPEAATQISVAQLELCMQAELRVFFEASTNLGLNAPFRKDWYLNLLCDAGFVEPEYPFVVDWNHN